MFVLFKQLKYYLKGTPNVVSTVVSNLFKATSMVLMASCVLVCAKQYVGEHILCMQSKTGDSASVNEKVMNTYCFITTTYTVLGSVSGSEASVLLAEAQAHPGVQLDWFMSDLDGKLQETGVKRHAYYQWVPILLFVQAILFLTPSGLWNNWVPGILVNKLYIITNAIEAVMLKEPKMKACEDVASYFTRTLKTHRVMTVAWIFCDLLALCIVVGNFFLTDLVLGGDFKTYGIKVLQFLNLNSTVIMSPFDEFFPKVTKCTFRKFGPSGSLQRHDSMCIMALNIINEKIFAFLWFWFIFVAVITMVALVRKIATVLALYVCSIRNARFFLCVPILTCEPKILHSMEEALEPTDWIFLHLLTNNMTMDTFTYVSEEISSQLQEKNRLLKNALKRAQQVAKESASTDPQENYRLLGLPNSEQVMENSV